MSLVPHVGVLSRKPQDVFIVAESVSDKSVNHGDSDVLALDSGVG